MHPNLKILLFPLVNATSVMPKLYPIKMNCNRFIKTKFKKITSKQQHFCIETAEFWPLNELKGIFFFMVEYDLK